MDIKKLQAQLEIDEGVRYYVYLDSLGFPTFGIGHLLRKTDPEYTLYKSLPKGKRLLISKERVAEVFAKDCQSVLKDCERYLTNFTDYPEEVQQIVANMMFNLGYPKMVNLFPTFRKDLIAKNYKMAALEMRYNSGRNPAKGACMWYKQVKARAVRLVARMNALANTALGTNNN